MAYISIDRKLFKHFLWTERRPRTKFEAWIDLIQLVSFDDNNELLINGILIKWGRGEFPVSYSFLADRWIWSFQKVRGYMQLLKNNKQITTRTTGQTTILILCNYEEYNPKQQGKRQEERQNQRQDEGKRTAGIKEDKEDKELKKKSKMPDKPADFIDQIIDCFVQEHGSYEVLNKGKERAAASKILSKYKEKYPDANSEDVLIGLRAYFKQCVNIPDIWLMNNMSLSIIVCKFNEINKILRNGTDRKAGGATSQELANLIANKFGIDT